MRNWLEERVARQLELDIPVPKYHVLLHIQGNSREEISRRLAVASNNWDYEYGDRDEILHSTDGTTSVTMLHTNPAQTPEAYSEALTSWSKRRRQASASAVDRSSRVGDPIRQPDTE